MWRAWKPCAPLCQLALRSRSSWAFSATRIDVYKRQVWQTGTSAATNLLPDKIDAGDRICERQLDRLMQRYQTSNPDFYGAYQVARIIVDAGGGSGTPPTPPATPHP